MANRMELQNKTGSHQGIRRVIREHKRNEANERNSKTPTWRRSNKRNAARRAAGLPPRV